MKNYKLFSINYNDGDWGGYKTNYFIAQSEKEVKEKSLIYKKYAERYAKNPGHTFYVKEVSPGQEKYVNLFDIENGNNFIITLNFIERN